MKRGEKFLKKLTVVYIWVSCK